MNTGKLKSKGDCRAREDSSKSHGAKFSTLILVIALTIATLLAESAKGADYYVAKTGSDTNSGAASQPFRTPQKAADIAVPGDTIFIESGTYTDEDGNGSIIKIRRSGAEGQFITFQSRPGHTAVLADPTTTYGIMGVAADYIRIQNLEFGTVHGMCIALENTYDNGSDNWEILHNVMRNCGATETSCGNIYGRAGIFTEQHATNVLIDSNTIHSVGRLRNLECDSLSNADNHQYRHDHGIYAKGKYITIQNNVIYDTYAGFGIKVDGFNTSAGILSGTEFSHIIINNTFGPNTNPNPYGKTSGSAIRIYNSTPSSYNPRWLVKNNIFLNQAGSYSPVAISGSSSYSNVGPGNLCQNNVTELGPGLLSTCSEHIESVAINVTSKDNTLGVTDMGLAGAEDYHLTATSPAIAHGDPVLVPPLDKDGVARDIPANTDAGAYAFSISNSKPKPPLGLQALSD